MHDDWDIPDKLVDPSTGTANAAGKHTMWMRSMEGEDQRASTGWSGRAGLCSAPVFSYSDLRNHPVVEDEKDWWLVTALLKGAGWI